MFYKSTLVTAAALASTGSTAVLRRNSADVAADPYVGDIRTFTESGCSAQNQGVGTFTHSMTSSCNAYAEAFGSLYVHLKDGWEFRAYTTSNCSDEGTVISGTAPGVSTTVCNNQSADFSPWVAYSVYPTKA
ncbi:hypothetical protein F4820DRAFT_351351 [Hypoxylon rubiginosum]|uniref:Uncharacterized protein n=1 Tax=Hypoxylon rubiginosum TaxID=110542 RepID=A0ACB9YXB6_9PEZI|nr:hypothetical protein F4820DRAFT_351351 [Hypoxylon rubiginosum]